MRKLIKELIATLIISYFSGRLIDEIIDANAYRGLIPMVCTLASALRKYISYKLSNKNNEK